MANSTPPWAYDERNYQRYTMSQFGRKEDQAVNAKCRSLLFYSNNLQHDQHHQPSPPHTQTVVSIFSGYCWTRREEAVPLYLYKKVTLWLRDSVQALKPLLRVPSSDAKGFVSQTDLMPGTCINWCVDVKWMMGHQLSRRGIVPGSKSWAVSN